MKAWRKKETLHKSLQQERKHVFGTAIVCRKVDYSLRMHRMEGIFSFFCANLLYSPDIEM